LIAGRIFGLVCLVVVMAAVAYFINRAEKGKVPKVRRIAGIEIGVHYTWFLAIILIAWSMAEGFSPTGGLYQLAGSLEL
jgi:small-conductance mechanosensitive channel